MLSIKRESPASEILVFPKFTFHARWLAGLSRQTAATRLDQLALFIWTEDVCHANTGLHYMLFFLKWITFLPFHPLPAQQTPTQSPRLMDSLLKSSLFNLPPPELRSTLLILSQPFAHPSIILHFTLLNLCLSFPMDCMLHRNMWYFLNCKILQMYTVYPYTQHWALTVCCICYWSLRNKTWDMTEALYYSPPPKR